MSSDSSFYWHQQITTKGMQQSCLRYLIQSQRNVQCDFQKTYQWMIWSLVVRAQQAQQFVSGTTRVFSRVFIFLKQSDKGYPTFLIVSFKSHLTPSQLALSKETFVLAPQAKQGKTRRNNCPSIVPKAHILLPTPTNEKHTNHTISVIQNQRHSWYYNL